MIKTRTAAIQTAIVTFLNLQGHVAHRNHTTGVYDQKRKAFRKLARSSLGVGDILCCLKGGGWFEIEIKTGRDRLREEQRERRERIEKAGGVYLVVDGFDDFRKQYEQTIRVNSQRGDS